MTNENTTLNTDTPNDKPEQVHNEGSADLARLYDDKGRMLLEMVRMVGGQSPWRSNGSDVLPSSDWKAVPDTSQLERLDLGKLLDSETEVFRP